MRDYKPLDLARVCNIGTTFINPEAKPRIGDQQFHGLPFKIGADARRCFIGFDGDSRAPLTLSVQGTA